MLTEARQDAFILGTDGAQFVNRRDSHGWIVILTNLNTPWQARSRREDTFVSTIVPGPNNPIDLDSFLWPVLAELARAARGYWIWDGLAREWFLWRAWLVSSAADQQASSRLSHMTGPTGFSGCKTCHMKADYAREGQTVGYFPLETLGGDPRRAQERPIAYDPYDLPHRTDDSYAEDLQLDSRRETGIGKRSTLSGMPAFTIPAFFPPDIFHLFGINLPSQVWSALCESRSGDPFTLSVQQRETFAELLKGAESDLPTSFCSAAPRDPSTCAGPTYKMYEWTCILYYYLPPFLLSIGAPEEVISMLEHLIAGVRIASSAFGCTSVQLWQLQDHFVAFVEEWERLYVREDPDCLHRATISVHHLLHVWYFIHAHGSVTITSQARCEREIGTAKRGLRSRKSEFVGLMNNVIQREHLRILDSIVVDEDVSVPREHDPNDTKFEVRLAPHHRSLSAQQVDDMEQSFRSHQEIGNLPTPFPPRRIFRGRCRHLSFSFRGSDIEGPKARKSSRFVVNADGSEMYCEALRFVYFLEDGERHTDDDPVDVRRAFALCRYLTNVEAAGGLKRGKWSDELGTISVRSILRPIGTFEVGEHIYVLEKLSWMTSEE
ncbi:hypothetical protein OC844_001332 [Tilletia horrida]|nr:hypothetical protein OC844_001332 [Tilletia horrida]